MRPTPVSTPSASVIINQRRHRPQSDCTPLRHRNWLRRFAALLPAKGRILDMGCGARAPIACYFTRAGYPVIGVDLAAPILDCARVRVPTADWWQADMRTLDLPGRYHGIVAWNSFAYLSPDEQRRTLPRLAAHLRVRGVLMLTVGPDDGDGVHPAAGDGTRAPQGRARLGQKEYERILADAGLEVIRFAHRDPTCDLQSVLLARKADAPLHCEIPWPAFGASV